MFLENYGDFQNTHELEIMSENTVLDIRYESSCEVVEVLQYYT